jgi:hypothetical protein
VETGAVRFDLFAYESRFRGGVRFATGDFDRDGFDDVGVAPGAGRSPEVKVFSGYDGSMLTSFLAPGSRFPRGVFLTAEDLDGDGRAEFIPNSGPVAIVSRSFPSFAHTKFAVFAEPAAAVEHVSATPTRDTRIPDPASHDGRAHLAALVRFGHARDFQ